MSIKTIYTCVLIFGVMCVPYLEGYPLPYTPTVIGYAVGMLLTPVLLTAIAKAIAVVLKKELSFQNWFNGVGTWMLIGAIASISVV
ncbi:hypothetical protein N9Q90_02905 [Gammaproteobacteria bacterium]|nr:hypothetical protein [Gammaproteobacteria bacterium]